MIKKLALITSNWKTSNYKVDEYPAIKELLEFQRESGVLKYLRDPQLEAIETYFYLRLVEKTPKIFDLYKQLFPTKKELREALGIVKNQEISDLIENEENIFDKLVSDDDFVKRNKLESVKETLQMAYPSYILALTMGTGKTVLIGVIIALEFCLALEYPEADFMKNALVFAPGTTILESLKEIGQIPFERVLPPRFHKLFLANVKMVYARDGQKELQLEKCGQFHIIITNTEKIKLRAKSTLNETDVLDFAKKEKLEQLGLEVNARLNAITSLPNLGIFSDEAHNTYGQDLEKTLKRVRETINYIAQQTNLICVVNTTGTPYYKKQILKDVIYSYRLNKGMQDNILKFISNVRNYQMNAGSDQEYETILKTVTTDFIDNYKNIATDKGCPAKIAFYFKTIDQANQSKITIQKILAKENLDWGIILNTGEAKPAEIQRFNNLENPNSNDRIVLLVGKGKEGWNCPSLFATALIREVSSSNNFILQASTRCLRQTKYNTTGATIYLDSKNLNTLSKELMETEGLELEDIQKSKPALVSKKLVVLKLKIPAITVKKTIRTLEFETENKKPDLNKIFSKLSSEQSQGVIETKYLFDSKKGTLFQSVDSQTNLGSLNDQISCYQASFELSTTYDLDYHIVKKLLDAKFETGQIPVDSYKQIVTNISKESQKTYKIIENIVEQSLMIIKTDNMEKDTDGNYYIEIQISQDNLDRIKSKPESEQFGYHYNPYNFDSKPEISFFEHLLNLINQKPDQIEDIYFIGGLTNSNYTDFYFEYRKEDGNYGKYYPDFVIKRKDQKIIIVEIKSAREKDNLIDGENGLKAQALHKLVKLNPDKIQYEYVSVDNDQIPDNYIQTFKKLIS